MTQKEFLAHLGLTKKEMNDFMVKIFLFEKTLNSAQLDLFHRSHPTLDEASKSFGPDVSADDITKILKEIGNFDGQGVAINHSNCFIAKLPNP